MNLNSIAFEVAPGPAAVARENDAQPETLPIDSQNETETLAVEHVARCAFRFSNRNRCRMLVTPHTAPYCPQHDTFRPDDPDAVNLAPFLLGDLTEITTASQMQTVLGKIFMLLAQNRVSTRKAAVLTYILQQLLRTLGAVDHEMNGEEIEDRIIIDVPRPIRD